MILLELIIVILTIWLGARLGGIGIGFCGGTGVLILALFFGIKPGIIPFDVIEIIIAVIVAVVSMQVAGGVHYLVRITENLLCRHPRYITILAPLVTYLMTLLTGSGHTVFATLPVITEVAKRQNIPPCHPLSIAVIASQIAITASPLSAAVVFFASILEPHGVSYLTLLCILFPSTLIAVLCTAIMINILRQKSTHDIIYQKRLTKQKLKLFNQKISDIKSSAKQAVFIFLVGICLVILYAMAISKNVALIINPILSRSDAITVLMFTVATIICLTCKVNTNEILDASTFKSGMNACVCVMGVAWLGDTFIKANLKDIQSIAGNMLQVYPWMLAVILFFASTLLYSQAATTKALMPVALLLGVSPLVAIASFSAVSALFVLPTYPTLLAAVKIDDTGSTKIGKYVFNHPFIVPGTLVIILSVTFGFLFGKLIL
ncbi:anaerobic C4-dicarboxylate transporter [Candidatus Pantoea carbekii]|uniref:anaerobic C4-dicarboxylate transporter n=1 Tax=Candidatus Pantoea carbekii TaxID=1235990 RepID=UPI0006187469|nr:anaerobic C4-dicarboxylate transporter [Candidatus Pantoea carbekii]AKC32569.1 anaerobic C4-dicarboxylate transporter DcuA [Candidatus Pantoea carbekii]